jgi:hypothetical protein
MERWEAARDANRRIAQSAERLQFVSRMPLFCECDDPRCLALVLMTREEFAPVADDMGSRLTAAGHAVEATVNVERAPGYWLQRHAPGGLIRERRSGQDRRSGVDRRRSRSHAGFATERRADADRRSGTDRRASG